MYLMPNIFFKKSTRLCTLCHKKPRTSRGIKRLAGGEETTVVVPVVVEVAQVQLPLPGVLIEVGHVAIAVPIRPERAAKICEVSSKSLPLEYS